MPIVRQVAAPPVLAVVCVVLFGGCNAAESTGASRNSAATVDSPVVWPPIRPVLSADDLNLIAANELSQVWRQRDEPIIVANVWSTWCGPCVEEFPVLVGIANKYRDRGVAMVFISADSPKKSQQVLDFLEGHDAPAPAYLKTGSETDFIRAFHPEWSGTLPATIVLDQDRQHRFFTQQQIQGPELEAVLKTLLDPPTTPEGRETP